MAVLAVVLYHAKESYFPLGYLGVDVFFVISGFVVTPLIVRIFTDQTSESSLSNLRFFYKRRFYRLFPALAATLVFSAVLMFLLAQYGDIQRFARQGVATLLLAGNVGAYRFSGDYFAPNPNPLVHTWSLSVEEQIYLFLPIILIVILHNRKSFVKIIAVVLGVVSSVSFISFLFPTFLQPLYYGAGSELASQISFYSPIDRIWQFAIGGLAFLWLGFYQNRLTKISKGLHLLSLFAVVLILFGPIQINHKVGSILTSFLALTLIMFRSLETLPEFLNSKLEWIGDRSYSIYLIHMPLLYIAKYSPVTEIRNFENRILQSIIAVIASIILGALSYSKIENRYRNKGKNEPTFSGKVMKEFVAILISLLIIFLTLPGFAGASSPPMDKDRSDNGMCKFWTPNLDKEFHSRFLKCQSKFGQATVVLGDSHAMNIYNALYLTTRSNFFVGISTGGCRPNKRYSYCPYDDFERMLKSSPDSFEKVIFHQSGSYLISTQGGDVDSDLAFKKENSYRIMDNSIQFIIGYLNNMGRYVDTTWIGPFPELRVQPTQIQVMANQVKPNIIVKKAFLDLESHIIFNLKKEKNTFRYFSLSRSLGDKQFDFKVGSCILFRDGDHWSACGEKIFSQPIQKSLQD